MRIIEKLKRIVKCKIYWHRHIPFVIAEVINPEWEMLSESEVSKPLLEMYNENGNWYVLEGLDYFLFGKEWWTDTSNEILFNDSMHLWFNGKSDEEKYQMLLKIAKENIDQIKSKK